MSRPPAVASASTLRALELPQLLALFGELAVTDAGRERIAKLRPIVDGDELAVRRVRFAEVRRLLEEGPLARGLEGDLLPVFDALRADAGALDGADLVLVADLLRQTRLAAAAVAAADPPCPALAALLAALPEAGDLERRIGRTLDARGAVREDASPRLQKLATTARRSRDALYGELQALAGRHREELAEETVPLHAGRLVLKLRAGSRGRLKGLVHGRSGTGKSFYFEPLEVVESNNRLQEARELEEEERRRLFRELIEAVRSAAEMLAAHLALLAELDLLQAAARFAERAGGELPEVATDGVVELVEARHPLIDPRLATLRERALGNAGHTGPVVPLSLSLGPDSRLLVVTGPNAGGKTVALKTLGLLALAAQCGLPVPAASGSRLPPFGRVVATVGDEQDLLADRSTFSGRLGRLGEAWSEAGPTALILIDELGSGTDPEEGAALSLALLEGLLARRCLGVVTTHLGRLAAFALEQEAAFCAAMEFDAETGNPTYKLLPGAPGGSEALALARRLGLPAEWIGRAEELLGPEHRKLQRLLAEVESVRGELTAELARVRAEGERLAAERGEVERRRVDLEAERRAESKRLRAELAEFRRRVAGELAAAAEKLRQETGARGRKAGAKLVQELFETAPELPTPEDSEKLPIALGSRVEHRTLGWQGVVESLDRSRAVVRAAGKRLRCPLSDLRGLAAGAPESAGGRRAGRGTTVRTAVADTVAAEVNLIGRRVEAALEELDSYLDRALLTAHPQVRIIHGHGSGRLRRAVRDHLRDHPAVASLRAGRDEEGGDGATVAVLRE